MVRVSVSLNKWGNALMPRQDLIQLRAGTAAAWTTANPILALAEPGVETDTNKLKIGDGVTAWNSLAYTSGGSGGGGGAVDSVNGRTGAVTLAKSDVGLTNVDNTSDANKPVSTATQTALNAKVNTADLSELVDDRVATLLQAGSNITLSYNDVSGTLTISAAGGGGAGNTYFPSGW